METWNPPEPDWKQRPLSERTRLRLAVATAGALGVVAGVCVAAVVSGTPAACTEALHSADRVISLQTDVVRLASKGTTALGEGRISDLRDISNEISTLAGQLRTVEPHYHQRAEACRG